MFQKLFEKLEIEKQALGGKVFDVLGEAFDNISLKDLLIEAIRYGDAPETRAKLTQVIDGALDTDHLKEILRRNALVEQHMSLADLYAVKEEMERPRPVSFSPTSSAPSSLRLSPRWVVKCVLVSPVAMKFAMCRQAYVNGIV